MHKYQIEICESVGCGHPDKLCDGIADSILTAYLKKDPHAHIACEVCAFNKTIVIGGEYKSTNHLDRIAIAKQYIQLICPELANEYEYIDKGNKQSVEIDMKVSENNEIGAGDQGITVGYATNETKRLLPRALVLASLLMKEINDKSFCKKYKIYTDTKDLISIDENNHAIIVLAISHEKGVDINKLEKPINDLVKTINKKEGLNLKSWELRINKNGVFIIHGSIGDSGLTGRKLAVDTYGSVANHGGGAFSGKDYTKVDRTGAYYARWIARQIIKDKLAEQCEIKLSWEIGTASPISWEVNCFNTNKVDINKINDVVKNKYIKTVKEIVNMFKLDKYDYTKTTNYCHFIGDHPWEK